MNFLCPLNTVLISIVIFMGTLNSKAQEPECIDSKESFDANKWQSKGEIEYDKTVKAFVIKRGVVNLAKLFKEPLEFIVEYPTKTTHLYIQYEPWIFSEIHGSKWERGDVYCCVYPVGKHPACLHLDLQGRNGTLTVKMVELAKNEIGFKDVSILVSDLGLDDEILVHRIGIWYGDGTLEELQLGLETACGWIPPKNTSEPFQPLTKIDCIDTKAEYFNNSKKWDLGAKFSYIPNSGDIDFFQNPPEDGIDVFYMNMRVLNKLIQRRLVREDYSLEDRHSFFLYIKHYSYNQIQSPCQAACPNISVKFVDGANNVGYLDATSNSQWGHNLVTLAKYSPLHVKVSMENYNASDYFIFDKLALVWGLREGRSDAEMIEAIDRVCWSRTTIEPTVPSTSTSPQAEVEPSTFSSTSISKDDTETFPSTPTETSTSSLGSSSSTFPSTSQVDSTATLSSSSHSDSSTKKATSTSMDIEIPNVSKTVVIILSVAGWIVLILVAVLLIFVRRVRKLKEIRRNLTEEEEKQFRYGNKNLDPTDNNAEILTFAYDPSLEISPDWIEIDENSPALGAGEFGVVRRGFLKSNLNHSASNRENENEDWLLVAVKMPKFNVTTETFIAFLNEIKIMAYVQSHENVLKILGASTTDIKIRRALVALEFCELGNLKNFLRDRKHNYKNQFQKSSLTKADESGFFRKAGGYADAWTIVAESDRLETLDLLNFSLGIANGMNFLAEKKVIHGDLAARNVLLTRNRQVKISDFGFSTQLKNYENYAKTTSLQIPWRWFPIEALVDRKFRLESDRWSYGILLYEIFSLGEDPYPGVEQFDPHFVQRLRDGYRTKKPDYANGELYVLMTECWQKDPSQRPTFSEIGQIILSVSIVIRSEIVPPKLNFV